MQIVFRGLCAFAEWVSDDPKANGRFTVILPSCEAQGADTHMPMHHAALCVPVNAYTNRNSEPTCIVPGGMAPSNAQWQPYGVPLAVWELEGRELTIAPASDDPVVKKGRAIGYRSLGFVPSLGDANEGNDWVIPQYVTAPDAPVCARVQLVGGSITAELPAHPMMTTKKWRFGSRHDVGYTDQVSYQAAPADMYTLVLTDLGRNRPTITIDLNLDANIFVTHLPKDAAKEHFKGYWGLLQNPNPLAPVPDDGQAIGILGQKGSYPGDCLNCYARFKP